MTFFPLKSVINLHQYLLFLLQLNLLRLFISFWFRYSSEPIHEPTMQQLSVSVGADYILKILCTTRHFRIVCIPLFSVLDLDD
jgi:hypothetical protein